MQSFCGRITSLTKNVIKCSRSFDSPLSRVCLSQPNDLLLVSRLLPSHFSTKNYGRDLLASCKSTNIPSIESRLVHHFSNRGIATLNDSQKSDIQDEAVTATEVAPRVKFKRLDKTARHIMQILDKEAVKEVNTQREIPDIRPGYIIQLKLEVPENKRRVSTVKGIVIARRNAGLNSTIRLRRLVAGVGVESLLPLYSPNVKEIKVLDKKKVRRAKLYYLRDKMNALRK
ncbi:unnamed protein product [Lactuca saligna]|uniref:50S ribosomal protein L19, chloroplastic n=1 Tax=Lactuca saligna TaxID=75948 RepID=A0AA36E339_LACSI|nr:unnamed protein product [Lactuca saligna]